MAPDATQRQNDKASSIPMTSLTSVYLLENLLADGAPKQRFNFRRNPEQQQTQNNK